MPSSTSRPARNQGRASVTVRDWVWSPKARLDPTGAGGPVGEVLAGTGIRTADWAAWEQVNQGRDGDFLTSLTMEFMEELNRLHPTMPLDRAVAWMITLHGWYDRDSLREIAIWDSAGPLGWLYRAAGLDRREVATLAPSALPDEDTLRVMVALRGTPLPLG